jgi:hypothetical protein
MLIEAVGSEVLDETIAREAMGFVMDQVEKNQHE